MFMAVLLGLAVTAQTLRTLVAVPTPKLQPADAMRLKYDAFLEPLKSVPSVGWVGADPTRKSGLFLAQYVLAPTRLLASDRERFTVIEADYAGDRDQFGPVVARSRAGRVELRQRSR